MEAPAERLGPLRFCSSDCVQAYQLRLDDSRPVIHGETPCRLPAAVCSTTSLSRLAGDALKAVAPKSTSRALNTGSARPASISSLSLSMISRGVLFGAPIATEDVASKPGRKSPSVGMSGNAGERSAVVTASTRSLPVLMYSMDAGRASKAACTWPPSKSVIIGAEPRYG